MVSPTKTHGDGDAAQDGDLIFPERWARFFRPKNNMQNQILYY